LLRQGGSCAQNRRKRGLNRPKRGLFAGNMFTIQTTGQQRGLSVNLMILILLLLLSCPGMHSGNRHSWWGGVGVGGGYGPGASLTFWTGYIPDRRERDLFHPWPYRAAQIQSACPPLPLCAGGGLSSANSRSANAGAECWSRAPIQSHKVSAKNRLALPEGRANAL
jgi:hypothetical protein